MLTIVADVDVEVSINSRVKIPNLQLPSNPWVHYYLKLNGNYTGIFNYYVCT